uniref:Uncharacterized protein n=1 Tax=Arundo donax TaxID=35708 RepID=A0A0A9D2X0_ARUDO
MNVTTLHLKTKLTTSVVLIIYLQHKKFNASRVVFSDDVPHVILLDLLLPWWLKGAELQVKHLVFYC